MTDTHWLAPAWFAALVVPALVALWRRRGRTALAWCLPGDGAPLARGWRSRCAWLPSALALLGAACAIAALARPVRFVPAPPERLAHSVVVCLDRSSSMAVSDLAPGQTRLAVARDLARQFAAARAEDRLGCVAFARYPDLVCPPTLDHAAFGDLLAGVDLVAAEGPEDATGIGTAVAMAAEVLARTPPTGRVVVLLTDGEENVATRAQPDEIAPQHAAQWCAQLGVRVYAVAVGADPDRDTSPVAALAQTTGGRFFVAATAAALREVGDAIASLEPARFAPPQRLVQERFAPWLVVALLALFAAHVLQRTVWRVVP
ncbi:MAG: VWA domain-containing protein [Planctomycetes bacterium]|nr:VWA domain-containing protein [Planctomycetota bacterium]